MTEKDLLGSALEAVKGAKWIPDWGEARIELMLKGSPDWCVSRQRTLGVPITLFVHKQTQELHPRTEALFEEIAALIEEQGMDAWFEADADASLAQRPRTMKRSLTLSMSGLIPGSPISLCCSDAMNFSIPLTCIWRALISTGAGSTHP